MTLSRRAFLATLAGAAASLLPGRAHGGVPQARGEFAVVAAVLAGTDATLLTDHAVLVKRGRIEAIVPAGAIGDRACLRFPGCTVMPGVINCHTHRIYTPEERRERHLIHGVTSIGDPGAPIDALPRLLGGSAGSTATAACSGPMLCPPGGYPLTVHSPEHGLVVTSPEHGRERVRQLADLGATMVKFSMEPGPYPVPWPMFDARTVAAICDEAHKRSLVARCHLEDLRGLETALAAGVHTVEHVPHRLRRDGKPVPVLEPDGVPIRPYRDQLERMVREGVIMTPTLDVLSRSLWHGPELYEPVRHFAHAGGRVAVGNDHPYRRTDAGMPIREMTLLGRAGLDASDILTGATATSARACGFRDRGTLTPGSAADMIVVEGNPLEDVSTLTAPRLVIKDGVAA